MKALEDSTLQVILDFDEILWESIREKLRRYGMIFITRNLPLRNTRSGYRIWISEVIPPAERVVQGLDYYHRFVDRFPDVSALAAAPEEERFSGCGKVWVIIPCAQSASGGTDGDERVRRTFPGDYQKILSWKASEPTRQPLLPSFAFNEAYPVLDGNVMWCFRVSLP